MGQSSTEDEPPTGYDSSTQNATNDESRLTITSHSNARPPSSFEIHEVRLPPRVSGLKKLKVELHEIFFPDDPLHAFRNQSLLRKLVIGVQCVFPILEWAPQYNLQLFKSDLIAGLTIASLSIPQGISYAKLAHLPPILGLYTSFVPPLLYAVLGSSRHLGIGPTSIASLVMGTMLGEVVPHIDDPELYIELALTATLIAGLLQFTLGIFRLGFIIDFLSKATLIGFMAGAAVIVALQQLKGLFGITHFTGKMQIIPVLESVFIHENEWMWQTIVMGSCFLVLLLIARHISARNPKLFWVSAGTPLLCVIISTTIIFFFKKKLYMIPIIGVLPEGVNPSSLSKLHFHGPHLGLAIKTGIVVGILALTEGIAVGRTFAALQNYQVNGNKEMVAIGAFSRSAVNYNAGAKTACSNIIMALTVLVTLLFLMPLFHYTPNLILSAIIITAVIGLIDYEAALKLWKLDKLDFLACLCSFFGVLFISVPMGLAIAVGVSILKIILHVTRPKIFVLGHIPGTEIYHSLIRYSNAVRVPSFLILGIESPIFFANSMYLQERVLRWIREEETRIQEHEEPALRCVILDMTAVTAIDTSGIDALEELKNRLGQRSLELVLVNLPGRVMEKLHHSEVLNLFRTKGLYLTVGEAVTDISSSWMSWA
ncbi:hypothetical protein ACFE04_019205 [Oxalis oulophora]